MEHQTVELLSDSRLFDHVVCWLVKVSTVTLQTAGRGDLVLFL